MRSRVLSSLLPLTVLMFGLLASCADAYNNGRGYYGETNDKVVTNTGFILIAFFPILVFALSMLQRSLERRKEARKAAHRALAGNAHLRGGW